ncbi:MAG: AAA family ATPase [Bdellovibrio sp.]|nr:AAA family ATPase [Bdellovibrio sp.]
MQRKDFRVVLTGGPGGGKTTAADLYRREIGPQVVIVPESASLLYSGGFPRSSRPAVKKETQKAIYQVQIHLEEVQAAEYESRVLLCDRGTIDGAVYWPGEPSDYFASVGTTLQLELARYDAVLFFETAAIGGISIEGGNPNRIESIEQAVELDRKLRAIWSQHENFIFIAHSTSFLRKVHEGLIKLQEVVGQHLELSRRPFYGQ